MDKFQAFGKNLTNAILARTLLIPKASASFTPFAARTQQFVKEQLGQANEKTELPSDYLDLEKRVEAFRQAHAKMLAVTSQYTNEAYDYPPNLRETFNDMGRTISEKVSLLSAANSASEASAALTAPPQAKPQPKTFNHAIARAALASATIIKENNTTTTNDDPLANALEKYALAEEQVGDARLNQDAQIQSRFLAGWSTTLHTNLRFAQRARKQVDDARLHLDATKARLKSSAVGRGMNPDVDSAALTEEARAEIEKREDELVAQTEEAENVMKNVLDTPEPLRNLAQLIVAQMEFHKHAYEILSELLPVIEGLQEEQETAYRKNRGTA